MENNPPTGEEKPVDTAGPIEEKPAEETPEKEAPAAVAPPAAEPQKPAKKPAIF